VRSRWRSWIKHLVLGNPHSWVPPWVKTLHKNSCF